MYTTTEHWRRTFCLRNIDKIVLNLEKHFYTKDSELTKSVNNFFNMDGDDSLCY